MSMKTKQRRTDHPDAARLLEQYLDEIRRRLGGFDEARSTPATADDLAPPDGLFLVLYEAGEPAACGGIKRLGAATGEIKRMFVAPSARRRGHGSRVLAALEQVAVERGWPRVVLDTAAPLAEARALYRRHGYYEVPAYNDNQYATAWFEKDLGSDFGFAHPRHARLWAEVAPRVDNTDLSHDRCHLRRVYAWSQRLARDAGADSDLAGAAALVHDLVSVPKESAARAEASERSAEQAADLLARAGYSDAEAMQIREAVRTCSWSRGLSPTSPLGEVLQDADRLDAIGATGVARSLTCAQGMAGRGRRLRLWDPQDPLCRGHRAADEASNALDHFQVKLLRLAEGMHLPAARQEALRRQQAMEAFLEQVRREAETP